MDKLISTILSNFDFHKEYEDIISNLISFIIGTQYFDIGIYLFYDYIKDERKKRYFRLGGIFNEVNIRQDTMSQIQSFIQNNPIIIDDDIQDGCGIFHYVIRKFLQNKYDDCFIAIKDVNNFKSKDPRGKYFADINYGNEVKSEIVFPVSIQNSGNINDKLIHAVVVFDSFTKKNVSQNNIKSLSELFNLMITKNINELTDKVLLKLINSLSKYQSHPNLTQEDNKIFHTFNLLNKSDEFLSNSLLPFNCLLKYGSLFSLNDIHKKIDSDNYNFFLVKNKAFNFTDVHFSNTNIITDRAIFENKTHLFYEYITMVIDKIKKGDIIFQNLVKIIKCSEIHKYFYNPDMFFKSYTINDDDILILIPILPHLDDFHIGNVSIDKQLQKISIKILALYFDKDTYSYYYNYEFLELISHKIYENYQLIIHSMRRDLRKKIINNFTPEYLDKDLDFYYEASLIMRELLGVKDVHIYLYNQYNDKLVFSSSNINRDNQRVIDEILNDNDFPEIAKKDIFNYIQYFRKIKKIKKEDLFPLFWHDNNFHENIENISNDIIHSVMILPIWKSENKIKGFIILINNNTFIHNQKEPSCFSKEEYEVATIGAEVISKFSEILDFKKISEKMLRKLKHEIPSQCGYILQNNELISEVINHDMMVDFIKKNREVFPNIKHIKNILNQLKMSAKRINLYSEYSAMKDFSKEVLQLSKKIEIINFNIFISSSIDAFRSEAKMFGLHIKYRFYPEYSIIANYHHTIIAHPILKLAIDNIINNALHYSYIGTTINIEFRSLPNKYFINISNIGIPLKDIELIFQEGKRTDEAINKWYQGSGYGLYLTKNIIEGHGGKVYVNVKNNIYHKNIFALREIKNMIKLFQNNNQKIDFLNLKLKQKDKFTIYDINKITHLLENEFVILDKYKEYQFDKTFQDTNDLMLDYLSRQFKVNKNFLIILKNYIEVPISHITFTIELDKEKL